MEAVLADIRYGIRRLRRSPGFAFMVVLTLAIGIGANTAIFSAVNAVLLRPLPYAAPDELVSIRHIYPGLDLKAPISAAGFRNYRENTTSFTGLAVETGWAGNLTGDGEPERVAGRRVTGDYFAVYGVPAALGRTLLPEEAEAGRDRVAVISDAFWRRRFGADPSAIGRDLQLNGESYRIVGVMPPGFRSFTNRNAELWAPLVFTPEQLASHNEYLNVTARLKPGVTLEAASAEMTAFADRIKQAEPDLFPEDWTLDVVTLNELASGDIRPALLMLLGAVGFVLLIACANVANLLLVRAAGRIKEVAVRRALGADRVQLVRQFMAESLVLALAGGLLGLVLAWTGVRSLGTLTPRGFSPDEFFALDGTVLFFTLLVSVLTGLLFGLAPALQAAGADVQSVLREGGRGMRTDRAGQVLRRSLVVVELALALTLLIGAGLLIRSFDRLQSVDPGFNARNLLTFTVALPQARYPSDTAQIAFFDQSLDAISAVPGVTSAAVASVLPFSGGWSTTSFEVEGYEVPEGSPGPWGDFRVVSPSYFETLGVPLVSGRVFDDRDREGSPLVAVVDEELVRRYFAGRDPLAHRLIFGTDDEGNPQYVDVIGVVAHTKQEALDAEDRIQVYFSYRQAGQGFITYAVRTPGDPQALVPAVRQAVRSVDPAQPIAQVNTMEQLIDDSVVQKRLSMLLLTLFAGVALLLAVLGIYGVMSYLVSERVNEIGVRMALGARRSGVLLMVMRQGMGLVVLGLGIGLLGAFGLTRLLSSQLYEVEATDPVVFTAVSGILLATAVAGTLIPALRATRVDPMAALRAD